MGGRQGEQNLNKNHVCWVTTATRIPGGSENVSKEECSGFCSLGGFIEGWERWGKGGGFFSFFYRFTILPQHLVAKELAGKITLEPHIFLEQH